jgi:predicted DNA-binding transcriptional regulator AlpA
MSDLPKVVSAKIAARLVGLSESTLAKLRLNGNGPVYCRLGRRVVYRQADLEQWLQSRTARDTSDADARFLRAYKDRMIAAGKRTSGRSWSTGMSTRL